MLYQESVVYTVPELAERWKVHPITVYRMLESRQLPGFKIGKAWRISALTVEAYEQQNALPNTIFNMKGATT